TLGPANMAANAKPDGYTIAQFPITVFRLPFMTKTSFDPVKDFTYIIGLTGYTFGVVVRSDAPWKSFGELLAYAKANPGKITYGTPGPARRSTSPWSRSRANRASGGCMCRSAARRMKPTRCSGAISTWSPTQPAGRRW